MDDDLLYTNRFVNTENITRRELNEDANNFVPYSVVKEETTNDVRDELERNVLTNNNLNQKMLKAYGWNRGSMGNQRPVLSDFARDIGESSYFRYKTTYVNIDSRMRDVKLYPKPNDYKIFLGRKYNNVESIKMVDYFIPDSQYPINERNNALIWFTIPYEMLFKNPANVTYYTLTIPNGFYTSSYNTQFALLANGLTDCEEIQKVVSNNLLKCFYADAIPPGNYTVEELEREIEKRMGQYQFFNSNLILREPYLFKDADSETKKFYQRPINAKVRISAETSKVDFLLRYEELKAEYLKSYNGKNYFDVQIKVEDPLVSSQEYLDLAANEIYPIVFTDMPGLGGLEKEQGGTLSSINYVEFLPFEQILLNNEERISAGLDLLYANYYTIVKDSGTGEPIPNVLRFYLYNEHYQEIIFSYSEKIEYDGPCKLLCDGKFGREAPFFLFSSENNPFSEFLRFYNNNVYYLNPEVCKDCNPLPDDIKLECERKPDTKVLPEYCEIISDNLLRAINDVLFCNEDGSSKLLTNLLGFFNTNNDQVTIEPERYARGIQTNMVAKTNTYINTLERLGIINQEINNYLDCEKKVGNKKLVEIEYKTYQDLYFRLPVCKGSDGKYYFYFDNYIFLKLLTSSISNNLLGSQIEQVKPTPNFGNGSSDIYRYTGDLVRGFNVQVFNVDSPVPVDCPEPEQNTESSIINRVKDVNDLFAKIKLSTNPGSCEVQNPYLTEVVFFDGSISSLDEFVVQFVDYEGKLIELNREHNFVLKIVEKIEILKETNINSRTGYVNTGRIERT